MWKTAIYKDTHYVFYVSKSINYEEDRITTIYYNSKYKEFFHNQYKKNMIKKGYEIIEVLEDRLIIKKKNN